MPWEYNYDTHEEEWVDVKYVSARKAAKIANDPTKHYPNKDEATLLRKIMAENGLTEEEVRSIKKYRVMLSEAQKSGEKRKWQSKEEVFYKGLIKNACKKTGLVPQHPETIVVLQELINETEYRRRNWFGFAFLIRGALKAETAVKLYAK